MFANNILQLWKTLILRLTRLTPTRSHKSTRPSTTLSLFKLGAAKGNRSSESEDLSWTAVTMKSTRNSLGSVPFQAEEQIYKLSATLQPKRLTI
jgi:hypothetical protein